MKDLSTQYTVKLFSYVFSRSRVGLIEMRLPNGHGRIYGDVTDKPIVMGVSDWSFFKRVIQGGGVELGTLYDQRGWKTDQLDELTTFLTQNKKYFKRRLKFARLFYYLIQPWLFFKKKKVPQSESEKYFADYLN